MGKEMVKCLSVAAAFVAGVASASTVGTSYWEPPMHLCITFDGYLALRGMVISIR